MLSCRCWVNRDGRRSKDFNMLSFQQAKEIAEKTIQDWPDIFDDTLIIIDREIIETPYAWIFPYTSKRWLEGDDNYAILGNAPLFIAKQDGRISTFSTAFSVDKMIDEYEEKNRCWCLKLTTDIYSETKKLLTLKNILEATQNEILELKTKGSLVVDSGAKRRLERLADLLKKHGIDNEIIPTDVI